MSYFSREAVAAIEAIGVTVVKATGPVGNHKGKPYVIYSENKDLDQFLLDMKDRGVKTVALYQHSNKMIRYAYLD